MFLFKFKGVKSLDVYNKVFKYIVEHKIYNMSEILIYPDLSDNGHKIENVIYSYMVISLSDLINKDDYDIEEIFFDLIEGKHRVVFDMSNVSDEEISRVRTIADEIDFKAKWGTSYEFDAEPNLACLDDVTLSAIVEIFELPQVLPAYSMKNFLIQWTIDADGNIFDNNMKMYGNINEMDMTELFFRKTGDYLKLKKIACNTSGDAVFTQALGDFIPLLTGDKDILSKIERYKVKVFNAIKNIPPKEYANLDVRLVQILNQSHYIQLNDAVEIIHGDDYLSKKDKPLFVVM